MKIVYVQKSNNYGVFEHLPVTVCMHTAKNLPVSLDVRAWLCVL